MKQLASSETKADAALRMAATAYAWSVNGEEQFSSISLGMPPSIALVAVWFVAGMSTLLCTKFAILRAFGHSHLCADDRVS